VDASRVTKELEQKQELRPFQGRATPGLPLQDTPPEAEGITFSLSRISIKGSTVYKNGAFRPLYADKIGREVSLAFIFNLANAITTQYRNDGYILSRAIVPAQEIRDGRVTIEIVEGYVDDIVIRGSDIPAAERIYNYAENIRGEKPLHITRLERYLLLIRDIPGYSVESLLQPAAEGLGAARLVLDVEYRPYAAAFGIDNFGTKYLGPTQGTLRLQANSKFTSPGDTTVFRYIGTDTIEPFSHQNLRYMDLSHSILIGPEGSTMTVGVTRALSFPTNSLQALGVKSRSSVLTVEFNHPFIRSRRINLTGGLQMAGINTENRLAGNIVADDRLRVLRLRGTFDAVDAWRGISQVTLEMSQGLNTLGASDNESPELSRADGRADFTKFNMDAARLQHIYGGFNLYTAVAGQFTSDRLLAAEEFGLGGSGIGRGYDPSEITGDSGIAGKAELQYSHAPQMQFLQDYQLFAFYDIGKVFQSRGKDSPDVSIASAGIGTRFNLTDTMSGSFTVAKPLTKDVAAHEGDSARSPRAFFSLSIRY
jgi:hemolysin activation/secretion protein